MLTLTPQMGQNETNESDLITDRATMWKDLGPYLLFTAIPFFIWLFRKGVFFALLVIVPLTTQAGIFERPDQTAYRKTMSGVDAYRIGNYEAAKQVFEAGQTADDLYNAGNAKAYLNDIQGAINSYDKALQLNPNHAEAKFNKEYLQRQMPPKQQNQNQQNNEENQDTQETEQNQNNSESSEQQDQNNNSSSSDQQNEQNADPSENQNEESQSSDSLQDQQLNPSQPENQESLSDPQNESDEQPMNEPQTAEEPSENDSAQEIPQYDKQFDQESEQLLNKIKQDPSRLLRYRLYQQYIRKSQ